MLILAIIGGLVLIVCILAVFAQPKGEITLDEWEERTRGDSEY